VGRPHVITHLFADGGRGIKTMRVDYSKHSSDYRTVVQHMMREQHRAMASDLRKGRVDAIIDGLTPRQTPPGAGEATRSLPAPAVAGESPERREPALASWPSRNRCRARTQHSAPLPSPTRRLWCRPSRAPSVLQTLRLPAPGRS
jgi:hypothetical protein